MPRGVPSRAGEGVVPPGHQIGDDTTGTEGIEPSARRASANVIRPLRWLHNRCISETFARSRGSPPRETGRSSSTSGEEG